MEFVPIEAPVSASTGGQSTQLAKPLELAAGIGGTRKFFQILAYELVETDTTPFGLSASTFDDAFVG
jgi:hypothetical protein